MSFFNLGKKDEYGRQRRIEHQSRYLRASRTGGVALRAQAKAAGVNVTGNTSNGFRVSGTPMENTQVALQNGRFVLRGRYGDGPTKLNVSKTGATVSTRNELGSFNWIKPNRSSAKIAGVQMRGKNAAYLQMFYMLFVGVAMVVQLLFQALVMLFRLAVLLGGIIYRLVLATPYALAVLRRRARNARLGGKADDAAALLSPPLEQWERQDLIDAVVLILTGWGQGRPLDETAMVADRMISAKADQWTLLQEGCERLAEVADRLETARSSEPGTTVAEPRVLMAALALRLARSFSGDVVAETILQADELALEQAKRTRLQEQLIQVYGDFAGIRFQEQESAPEPQSEPNQAETSPSEQSRSDSPGGSIDLNSATLEQLQSLPGLGPERAREVIAMRPIQNLEQLACIDGIGPKRLEAIRAQGVICS